MKLLSVFTLFVLLLVSSSYKNVSIPDPEDYAKKILEIIKKNNKEEYVKTFSITSKDFLWLGNQMDSDIHVDPERKAEWHRNIQDTTGIITDMNEKLLGSYDQIIQWVQEENIDLEKIEYIRMYYEIEYEKGISPILRNISLFVKHEEKYYGISMKDVTLINGRWTYGRVVGVSEYNQYFEIIRIRYGDVHVTDSTAKEEYAVDTAYAVYEEEPQQIKKQQKIQKKIDALNRRKYQLYDEMYKEVYK